MKTLVVAAGTTNTRAKDNENPAPRAGCRYAILSSKYGDELAELRTKPFGHTVA